MLTERPDLPKYYSHKIVEAFQIATIAVQPDGSAIIGNKPDVSPFIVSATYVSKHRPLQGGYYVRYEDGYESWSPAKAFEEGYTPIG